MARGHPQLHILSSYTDRFVDLVGKGFDCAIRVGHLPDSVLVARRVGSIFGILVASPEYIVRSRRSLTTGRDRKSSSSHARRWQFMDGDRIITVRPQGRFVADSGISLASAALDGIGIGYLPESLVADHICSGALVPIMTRHPIPPAGIFVVRPPGQHPSRKVRILTEMLIERFGTASVKDGAAGLGQARRTISVWVTSRLQGRPLQLCGLAQEITGPELNQVPDRTLAVKRAGRVRIGQAVAGRCRAACICYG